MPEPLRYGDLQITFQDSGVVLRFWDLTVSDLPQSVTLDGDQAEELHSALSEWLGPA